MTEARDDGKYLAFRAGGPSRPHKSRCYLRFPGWEGPACKSNRFPVLFSPFQQRGGATEALRSRAGRDRSESTAQTSSSQIFICSDFPPLNYLKYNELGISTLPLL